MRLTVYYHYWLTTAKLSLQTAMENRLAVVFFTLGKLLRFVLFIGFIFLIGSQVQAVSGYSLQQLIVIFLVFNLFDLFGQIFFRGIYWFRDQIVTGEFDFRLVKPLNPLFQVLTRQTDILDIPLLIIVILALWRLPLALQAADLVLFGLFSLAACVIITALHILIAALGVLTTEVDHTIMIYRDLSGMARFPVDIYGQLIRSLLTFAIPIALAFTLPAQALLGWLTPRTAFLVLLSAGLIFSLSLKLWYFSLSRYSSASS
ncbi:hypothetical protein A2W24_03425 [Microgenomates group bacterium RBG_16_45_19]|nr:MAG: hypothetical protein A2W24_03425 [Microgenomates group bacterium RBG_16_45_19]